MEVVPALLGLARALQKSASARREAFKQLVESKGGVTAAACKPHPSEDAGKTRDDEMDLDDESITLLLKTVSGE